MKEIQYFEDFVVDEEQQFQGEYELTSDEIVEIGRRWDPQPWHTDEAAAKDTLYGGLVASSAHLFAITSWFGTNMPKHTAALAALGFDELRIHAPGRVGDRLHATARCIEKRASRSKPDRGIVISRMELLNQNDELILSMCTTFMVARRPTES
jgi:acyl dehydratase